MYDHFNPRKGTLEGMLRHQDLPLTHSLESVNVPDLFSSASQKQGMTQERRERMPLVAAYQSGKYRRWILGSLTQLYRQIT